MLFIVNLIMFNKVLLWIFVWFHKTWKKSFPNLKFLSIDIDNITGSILGKETICVNVCIACRAPINDIGIENINPAGQACLIHEALE